MEWQQIVGFYQVVNFGSITKAAEATFRTQSALSQQISALEREKAIKTHPGWRTVSSIC
jgi:DNA-binding transcriptional LysR family regulator